MLWIKIKCKRQKKKCVKEFRELINHVYDSNKLKPYNNLKNKPFFAEKAFNNESVHAVKPAYSHLSNLATIDSSLLMKPEGNF